MLNHLMAALSTVCGWFQSPWIETVAEVIGKSSPEVVRENPDAFVPVTNPVTRTMLLLPIATSAAKKQEFHLHLDFIGMKVNVLVSQETFKSVEAGDRIKLKFRLGRKGKIKKIKILDAIKKGTA